MSPLPGTAPCGYQCPIFPEDNNYPKYRKTTDDFIRGFIILHNLNKRMILSKEDIKYALDKEIIDIRPKPTKISTSSVDLTLGETFKTWPTSEMEGVETNVNLSEYNFKELEKKLIDADTNSDGSVEMKPRSHRPLIGYTRERIILPKESGIAARVQGRSSFARQGLFVHITAPTIHCGFRGIIALEFYNVGPFTLTVTPGLQVCQIIFEKLESKPLSPLSSKFQDQSA